ncbi:MULTISPECIES: hypothetical protein [Rhizobium]|uniref:Lipoprotein n=2 Tax=Rhizobium grahamii TaxID=1120045 RepID=S3HNP1_9HYPH|nr:MULTISPECIES: hypothetical protein [Rhizobium]EPF00095.1 hypothetical protein RGCCGE502_02376 [Rhizobium grahamii CCGE 502]MBB3315224.1 hypothetical protein [Rhizobium sp. BK181]MBB3540437.1 hypothetical protein [Rhizobium sp. BK399]MCS3738552.1 hypothetical protein [Rhizobium sp. BK661]MCS4091672.1 hypothetical protein [Rhizobium sp. BK176]
MLRNTVQAFALCAVMATLASCVDANMPTLVPVAWPSDPPLNLPAVAHHICTGDSNFMYRESKKQYELRAGMGRYPIDPAQQEATAIAAAQRQYVTCLSSQGYRIYGR